MSELKPCIRCGGHMSWNDNEFESAYVCDDCHYFIEWDGTPEEFVKWWNIRPIEDALQSRIAELEAYYDGACLANDGLKADIAELEGENEQLIAIAEKCLEWHAKFPLGEESFMQNTSDEIYMELSWLLKKECEE